MQAKHGELPATTGLPSRPFVGVFVDYGDKYSFTQKVYRQFLWTFADTRWRCLMIKKGLLLETTSDRVELLQEILRYKKIMERERSKLRRNKYSLTH